jgi:hypothetical protein
MPHQDSGGAVPLGLQPQSDIKNEAFDEMMMNIMFQPGISPLKESLKRARSSQVACP